MEPNTPVAPDEQSSQPSPNELRLAIARTVIARKRGELGEHLLAAAVYGSVAHHAAQAHSDVELVLLTDDATPALEEMFFEQGVMVECDRLPFARMLAAAPRVTMEWGVEADQYRHHLVVWDTDTLFPQVWVAANAIPGDAWAPALALSWWRAYELRGKIRNAALQGDDAQARYWGWRFAYAAALRIALHERRPYESGRTLWGDVIARGYAMRELTQALGENLPGALAAIVAATDTVWARTGAWEQPGEVR